MDSKSQRSLPFWGGFLLLAILAVAGCNSGDDNSPSMGAVPPKPKMNMNAQLPPEVRAQMSQAKPGADAEAMSKMKPHTTKQ